MRKLPILFGLTLLLTSVFYSCEVDNCPPNARAFAHFAFTDDKGNAIKLLDTLTVIGEITANVKVEEKQPDGSVTERIVYDSLIRDTLINLLSDIDHIKVPLSYQPNTKLVLEYKQQKRADTIKLEHQNKPYFYNIDCGTMMFYEVTSIEATNRVLDSISITNPNIDNNEKENFKIHFTTPAAE